MIKAQILSKSGDNGWYDYDGCNYVFRVCELETLPPKGTLLVFDKHTQNEEVFIVKEVEASLYDGDNYYNIYVYKVINDLYEKSKRNEKEVID